jgi:NADPH:quinone reductase-like Zn-dependent oxidoreductase
VKSWHAESSGGIEGLVCKEHEQPAPDAREVLVKVRANSLNARELSVLRGTHPLPVKPDVVMCADGAGEVVELGPGVARVAIGDRVAAGMFPRWLGGRID